MWKKLVDDLIWDDLDIDKYFGKGNIVTLAIYIAGAAIIRFGANKIILEEFFDTYHYISQIKIITFIICEIVLIGIWWKKYIRLPRNNSNNIGIVIWVYASTPAEKNFKKDFINLLKNDLSKNKDMNAKVLILQNYRSRDLDQKRVFKYNKKVQAHYYLCWNIQLIKDWSLKYYINWSWRVFHKTLAGRQKTAFETDIIWATPTEYFVEEKVEFRWIQLFKNIHALAIRYIIGVAAAYSWDFILWYKILEDFLKESEVFLSDPDNYSVEAHMKWIKTLWTLIKKGAEYLVILSWEITWDFSTNDRIKYKDEMTFYVNRGIYYAEKYNLVDKSYLLRLNKAGILFINDDPLWAIEECKRARYICKWQDWAFRYSLVFLYLFIKNFHQAELEMKKIMKETGEDGTFLNHIQRFIEKEIFQKRPEKSWEYYYRTGLINYKKYGNLEVAKRDFNKYLELYHNWECSDFFEKNAMLYLQEIEKSI